MTIKSGTDRFGVDWSKINGTQFWRLPHMGRRVFFRHLTTALSGYLLMPSRSGESVARAAATPINTAKNCIFILLNGAPSHTDTFDLKEGAWTPAYFNPTSYGDIRWPQGLMPKLADQMDNIALLRSVRAYATAHGLAQTWVQIGRNPVSPMSRIAPHIGSVVSLELGSKDRSLPAFMSLNAASGPGAGFLPPDNEPFYVSANGGGLANTSHFDGQAAFDRRYRLMLDLDADVLANHPFGAASAEIANFKEGARKLMYNADINRIFALDQTVRNAYGNTTFGNACAVARNLLKSGMGTRFVQISFGSWDHHGNIYAPNQNLQNMARQFDNGLAQLMNDLRSDSMLDETLIVAMGEFGRTVGNLNQTAGRDHHQQQAVLFAGARVGRMAIGRTDSMGALVAEPGWSAAREIRAEDIEATIYSALGIDWTKVIRGDNLGRGFEYVPDAEIYRPVHELWG